MESRNLFYNLECKTRKLSSEDVKLLTQNSILKELYSEVKNLNKVFSHEKIEIETEQEKIIMFIFETLLSVIKNCDTPMEASLLCGTCIVSLAYLILGPEQTSYFLIDLLCYVENCCTHLKSGNMGINCELCRQESSCKLSCIYDHTLSNHLSKHFTEARKSCCTLHDGALFSLKPELPHLAILHGILSSRKIDLITCEVVVLPDRVIPFFMIIFHPIYSLCSSCCKYYFHAFQLLRMWLRTALEILENLHVNAVDDDAVACHYFTSNSEIIQKILVVLEANWENPINGVQESVRSIYRCLIEVHSKESSILHSENDFILFLLHKTVHLSWSTKGKYIMLASVLPFTSHVKFFEMCPEAPSAMISNIRLNYIASIISEVYKSLVLNMVEEHKNYVEVWCKWWKNSITDALTSGDILLLQNVKNYILPWSFKTLPTTYEILAETVKFRRENEIAEIILLQVAKDADVPFNEEEAYALIQKLLHHSSELLRMEAFSFLCSSPKKSETVSCNALHLIKEFLQMNLNIDSSAFNQRIMSQVKLLLVRIRDSTANEFSQSLKKGNVISAFNGTQFKFVHWLIITALNNAFPGACYQRRRSCLQILKLIYDTFLTLPSKEKKKLESCNTVKLFLSQALMKGMWNCYQNALLKIFPCLSDFTDDLRLASSDLLQEFFPWPDIPLCENNAVIDVENLLSHALSLCDSYHVKLAETGSLILRMLFVTYIVDKQQAFSFSSMSFQGQVEEKYVAALKFLLSLVRILQNQVKDLQKDFFNVISSRSVHGIVLAIHRCLFYKEFLKSAYCFQPKLVHHLMEELISLCQEVISHMLSVMSGNTNVDVPSFAEIGQALNDVLSKGKSNKSSNEDITKYHITSDYLENGHNMFDEVNIYSLTPEFQLLLSCCWHSIKNCCFLLSELVEPILFINIGIDIKLCFVKEILQILSTALTKCRHRGVIEACSVALCQSCKNLWAAGRDFEHIMLQLLHENLDSVLNVCSVSVTRRSAGIPLLLHAVIVGNKADRNGNLISQTVRKLLSIINTPLFEPFDDKKDLPQVHAYHILKVLTSDTTLSQQIILWIDEIAPACVAGFSSKSWAIRNGALQLFGVLLPRLCGQKKTKDDESEHNMILPTELFTRCPNLYPFLLKQLQKSISDHRNNKLCSELLPLLCLVSKLSCAEDSVLCRRFVSDFEPLLVDLLESPSWHVRNLAASSLSDILSSGNSRKKFLELTSYLSSSSNKQNNKVNGILMTVQNIAQKQTSSSFQKEEMFMVLKQCLNEATAGKWCDVNMILLLDVAFSFAASMNDDLKSILLDICTKMCGSEVSRTLLKHLLFVRLNCSPTKDVVDLVEDYMFSNQEATEACLGFLKQKWDENSLENLRFEMLPWTRIMKFIISHVNSSCHFTVVCEILKFIVHVCSDPSYGNQIMDITFTLALESCAYNLMNEKCGLSVLAFALTAASLCLKVGLCNSEKCHEFHLEFWVMKFYEFSNSRKPEILRLQAAEFICISGSEIVKFLSSKLQCGTDSVVAMLLSLCDGSLQLLQDENEDIRKVASVFPSTLPNLYKASSIQFNAAIMVVCQLMSDVLSTTDHFLHYLWFQLQNFPSTARLLQSTQMRKYSLFEQECVNVFAEPVHLTVLKAHILKDALNKFYNFDVQSWHDKLQMFATDVFHEISETFSLLSNFISENSTFCFIEYLSQPLVYHALVKLICQSKVITSQKEKIPYTSLVAELICKITTILDNLLEKLPQIAVWDYSNLDCL